MLEFAKTVMGRRFITSDIPRIASALEHIAEALEKNPKEKNPKSSDPKVSSAEEILKELRSFLEDGDTEELWSDGLDSVYSIVKKHFKE